MLRPNIRAADTTGFLEYCVREDCFYLGLGDIKKRFGSGERGLHARWVALQHSVGAHAFLLHVLGGKVTLIGSQPCGMGTAFNRCDAPEGSSQLQALNIRAHGPIPAACSVGKTLRIRSKEFTLPSTAAVSRFGQPRCLRVFLVEI